MHLLFTSFLIFVFLLFFICFTFIYIRELALIRRKHIEAESYRDQMKFELLEICNTSEESKIEILKRQESIRIKELNGNIDIDIFSDRALSRLSWHERCRKRIAC